MDDDIYPCVKVFPRSRDQLVLELICELSRSKTLLLTHDIWTASAAIKRTRVDTYGSQRHWLTQSKGLGVPPEKTSVLPCR